ncbi:hypothetical protein Taro_056442 [Colocasia esculenta]|uniref:Uncharacterized protein n=1 Tax=Colocasia esculenta TaxID=4460 RepID=A0A843XTI8_COLES|nr:hypothetical protein [Colocasia esculenta]
MASGDKTSFRGRKTFVLHSEIAILADDLPYSKNRLFDHNSESALRDGRQGAGFAEFRSGAKIPPESVCTTSTPTVVPCGRTRIFIRPGVVTACEAPIQNRHFDPVGKKSHLKILVKSHIRRFSVRRRNSSPGARSQAADGIAYGHPFAQTGITFHSVIGIAYKTPIRNRHSEALDARLRPLAIRRHFGDSFDYANRWRRPHTDPPTDDLPYSKVFLR